MPAQPAKQPAAHPNARRSRRHSAKGSTKVRCHGNPLGLGPDIASSLLDLSETGVRLLLKADLPVGREVEITLGGQSSVPVKQIARVVWVVPAGSGLFCAGCNFVKPLPYSVLAGVARV